MTTATQANPYATPTADLEVPVSPNKYKNGSLESGIAGDYDFTIKGILSEAWEKTNGLKGSFWGAAGLLFIGLLIVSVVLGVIFGSGAQPGEMPTGGQIGTQIVVQLLIMGLLYPFMAGIMMMGVKRSVDQPISSKMMFSYFSVTGTLIVAGLLSTIFIWIGFVLLIIPGLYLAIAYGLIIPLIADKKLSAWQAMEASRKAITKRWFKIFALYFVMVIILMVSMIPLGLGLIWTYPMMISLMGILYREIFGVTSK
ncbi:MAG: hypothetical protein KAH03_03855 [Cocleimonas sp.]|nr:hypothetical protein [Cocleimonas sp.]